ncbi:EPS-associated transcriptional regulator, MarR family [Alteromonadaceae bacterium Bs31]|nr:EPS-associated transcriptional regulator, MarR family [Alteromonadaceae bacterium Bs31]
MPQSAIPDELRYKLLKKIAESPEISQRELASLMGVSLGKTNYCLKALIEAGWVKVGNFARSHSKLNYVYVLTPKGVAEKTAVTLRFLKYKQVQYEQLEQEIQQLKHEAKTLVTDDNERQFGPKS